MSQRSFNASSLLIKRNDTANISNVASKSGQYTRPGLDTHADISFAGASSYLYKEVKGQLNTVTPFNEQYKALSNIKTCNVLYAHDTTDGMTYIINVNQTLDFRTSMTNSILCTNQARSNGVEVNDVPKIFGDGEHSQTIRFKEENVTLELGMHGPVPYLSIRCPTRSEIQDWQWLELTLTEQWNPGFIDQRVVLSVTTSLNQVLKLHPVDEISYSIT